MAVERYGSKTDVVVKLILVFFISLLSFSIGTFVGKKFSDNQHKLAQFETAPEETELETNTAAVEETDATETKKAMTDDEVSKLAEEFVAEEDRALASVPEHEGVTPSKPALPKSKEYASEEPEHATPAATAEDKPVPQKMDTATHNTQAKAPAPKPMKAATRVAEGKTPSEPVVETKSRIPQSLPREVASSASGKYTVQVASYPDEIEAQKVASELKNKGFSAFYVAAKVKDKTWYRVSVGLFATSDEAKKYSKDLKERAKVSAAIVQKITN